MIAMCIMLWLLGTLAAKYPSDRLALYAAALIGVYLAIERGFYWHIFARGHGWFTANRMSALAVFAAILVAPILIKRR